MSLNADCVASMAQLFLLKIRNSGMIEHRRRTESCERRWKHMTYKNVLTGQKVIFHYDNPGPLWVKVDPKDA